MQRKASLLNYTAQKMQLSITDFSRFTKEIRTGKLHFLCSVSLKFGDKFLTSLTKLVLAVKTSICSKTKEVLFLYYCFRYLLALS